MTYISNNDTICSDEFKPLNLNENYLKKVNKILYLSIALSAVTKLLYWSALIPIGKVSLFEKPTWCQLMDAAAPMFYQLELIFDTNNEKHLNCGNILIDDVELR